MTEGESTGADRAGHRTTLPPEQEAIRARCYHPSGRFIPFPEAAVEGSIPARFEEIARRYPDRMAVKTRNHALTYGELNEAANRVAHAIVALRGTGEEPVALLMDKGAPLIPAVMGVMKAAKFYVPLDPAFPPARTRDMLGDSGAGVVLTTGRHHALATELARDGIEVMNVEALDPGLSAANPGLDLSADSLSWLLYTSGSTGQPKGVLQNHRNILHRIMSYTNGLHVCAEDRLVLLHSMSVSGGTTYALAALLNGAALLPFRLEEDGLGNLTEWLIEERITIYNSVPTIFRHLAGILSGRATFPAIRVIRLGGEPVHTTDVDLYIRHFPPQCIFVNELGSTEAEVMRRYFVDPEARIPGPTVPIGYAIEDKEVLLLDEAGNQVGFGRIGEIAVRSRYLCVGYWRLPRLTAATFLPDPDGGTGHIYRTGDLGRMRPDQCLEHLGRRDLQVKVRGYRVELAEIEAALGRVDGLKEAVAATWEDLPGHARLVGYVVPSRHPAPTVSEIRSELTHTLPGHMVPAHFVYLDRLPLTPNGKVDRRALPPPDPARPDLDRPFAAPRTPTEEALVRIWRDVLGVRQVGIHDNFLDLGGDSLLASRVMSRVIDTFQVELLPQLLSTAPTVAAMALAIAQHSVAEERRIPREETAGPCSLSFGQQRLWFTNQMDPTSAAYNMPRAVRIRGPLDRVALQRALETIVARHAVLRTTYTATDGRPMQVVGQPRGVALPVIDLRESPEAEREAELEKLVEELQPRRSVSHSPLYQVVFALPNTPRFTPELSGLSVTALEVDRKAAPNDVVLYMTESERGLSAALEYSTDLFDATTIARMLGHFETLLRGIVADPGTPIGALPLVTDAERRQLLDEWTDRPGACPVETCIHQMFEVQAGRTPDAIAVTFEGAHLTYRELNRRANQVAHHLRALGVGPDVLVGTCMEPSPGIVIGLLGILKAGGAYLPLDPAYPRERLAFMLVDSRTSVLLADRSGLAALPATGARVVCLDTDGERIATESHEDPSAGCRPSISPT